LLARPSMIPKSGYRFSEKDHAPPKTLWRPRRTESSALMPPHRVIEPVVAPEHLAARHETRRAENAEPPRRFGRRVVGASDLVGLRECDDARGVLADLVQRVRQVRLHAAFLLLDEPAPIGRAHIVAAPAFARADGRDAVGEIELIERVGRLAFEGKAVHLGAAVQVAPHIGKLARLGHRPGVHLDHDGFHRERPPLERDAGQVLDAIDAHDGEKRVHAADREKEVDRRAILSWRNVHSSGSSLMIDAPWLLPTQKVTGVVELSTKTRRMLVSRGSRYSTDAPILVSSRTMWSLSIEPVQASSFLSRTTS